ncbi:hypothetical protein HBI21_243260 [Parastagonospora nodorum]|nr:hypothetical protein HBI21_243260 [Parastagonospora nodorum]
MILISDKYKILYAEMRSKQRKMQYNYNPKTRLRNNNRYAKAVFIQTLKREIEFKNKRSSIYYYTKTADIAIKLYRAIFVIKLLI